MGLALQTKLLEERLQAGQIVAAVGGQAPELWKLQSTLERMGVATAIINDKWSPSYIHSLLTKLKPAQVIVRISIIRLEFDHLLKVSCRFLKTI